MRAGVAVEVDSRGEARCRRPHMMVLTVALPDDQSRLEPPPQAAPALVNSIACLSAAIWIEVDVIDGECRLAPNRCQPHLVRDGAFVIRRIRPQHRGR